ncbi:MAG: RNA 2',3'-cyclic phosphodiesterase [candidate division KSB1 bacterium]|nr:RNA 2',3'-cyclic phosphodiesterase [candidate division KSB1 bacterium]MDZ7368406.1 RNA 2',3'-cyclic phosphodiesterase [candidate division KSB1 bacterium]MDZ7406018.1 RNA 2',3'-cyclic phosphodiesterase [candidate division KSB1 bacterium]
MEMLRTFIALDMPPEIKTALSKYVQPLRSQRGRVNWVKAENLHLTLKFLGDTPASRIEEIGAALQEIAAATTAFSGVIEGGGIFPNDEHPRVLWVGVNEKTGALQKLAKAIDDRMHQFGFAKEKRVFSPHLTIGRAKDQRIPEIIRALKENPFAPMPASFDEIIFMQSELHPAGSVYTPLRKLSLGKS